MDQATGRACCGEQACSCVVAVYLQPNGHLACTIQVISWH